MKITVAICTWNRADLLHETLLRMQSLDIPDGVSWELIVANNNCTDHTDEIIERHQSQGLPIRRLFVAAQGQCHSRNAVIDAADGQWILWTDDDVLVDPTWLTEYVNAIENHPQFSFMGGSITPWFETPPPSWLTRHFGRLEGAFAVTPSVLDTKPLGSRGEESHDKKMGDLSDAIFGANMAFSTDVMRQHPFDTQLGLVGDQPMRGDETDLMQRLVAAGHKGLWVGSAKVQHFIPTKRMTTRYLWDFFYGCGQAQLRMSKSSVSNDERVATLFGKPRWAVRGWLSSIIAAKLLYPLKNALWLHHFTRAAICAGVMQESRTVLAIEAEESH